MSRVFGSTAPRRAYQLGLALIVVLVTLQFAGTRIVSERQEVSAIQINLSGRQRMLSQRIAWTMYRIAAYPGPDTSTSLIHKRHLLAVCVDLMERSHAALVSQDTEQIRLVQAVGGDCLNPDLDRPAPFPTDRVPITGQGILSTFTDQAWAVAEGGMPPAQIRDFVVFSDGPLSALLGQLDAATLAAQEASTAQLRTLLSLNWVLILALVLGELVLIFRPMAKAVDASFRRLADTNVRLRESETRLQDFASAAAHQFWETDDTHRFVWIGASDPKTHLREVSPRLRRRPWDLDEILAGHEEVDWAGLRQTMDNWLAFSSFEFAIRADDGRVRWWRMHGRPVFAENGSFLGYRGTSREITREREAETRLRLSERMQALGQLTAGVAHDFNNMLAVIQGNAELIPMENTDAGRQKLVEEINAAVSRGSSLTARLLAFGRVQRMRADVVDLRAFLESLEGLLKRTLGESFHVASALPKSPLYVLVDPHQLEDACLNLALNARDAAPPGGRLWIEARLADPAEIALSVERPLTGGDYVCLTFRDNGSGIPDSVRQRIFEPFYTTKSVGEGAGLGLSMVYGFVLQSNGFIDVSSVVGEGTTFALYLPRAPGPDAPEPHPDLAKYPSGKGKSVLLVEDNKALRQVTRRHLETLGFLVTAAVDGGSALERLEDQGPYDLLVLDIVLPGGVDGLEVARRARQTDPSVGVVLCTGHIHPQLDANSDGLRGVPILRKPFTFEQLAEALSQVLNADKDQAASADPAGQTD